MRTTTQLKNLIIPTGLALSIAALPARALAAISLVQEIGTASSWGAYPPPPPNAFPDGQLWIEVATPVLAGNRVVVSFSMDPVPGFVTCTDGQDNTYTVDADVTTGSGSTGVRTVVFSGYVKTGLPVADKVLVIHPAAAISRAMTASEFTGLSGLAFAYDQTATATGASAPMTAGPVTTTRNYELVVGAFGTEGVRNFTPGGGFLDMGSAATGATPDDANVSVFSEYQVNSAIGSFAADATLDLSGSWAGAVVTYADVCSNLVLAPGTTCDPDANDGFAIMLRKNNSKPNKDSWKVESLVYSSSLATDVLAGGAEVSVDHQNGTFAAPIVTHTFDAADCKSVGKGGVKCIDADRNSLVVSPRNGSYRVKAMIRNTSFTMPSSADLGLDSLVVVPSPGSALPGTVRQCTYKNKGATLNCRQTN